MTKEELVALAREKEIAIDPAKKKAEIEAILVEAGIIEAPEEPKVKTVPVKLVRDAWDHNGVRQIAGTVAEFDVESAKKLIKAGAAERADPLPGDE